MPRIKNGRYANILLKGDHRGTEESILFKNKYYHIMYGKPTLKYKGLYYELQELNADVAYYTTTGTIYGDYALDYNRDFRINYPLLYKDGKDEIRATGNNQVGIDQGMGWILYVTYHPAHKHEEAIFEHSEQLPVTKKLLNKAYKVLTEHKH